MLIHIDMKVAVLLASLYIFANGIIIDPTTKDQYATVSLAPDPRGINKITPDNQWQLFQAAQNPLYDWYLRIYHILNELCTT